jgi:hypothetical protein
VLAGAGVGGGVGVSADPHAASKLAIIASKIIVKFVLRFIISFLSLIKKFKNFPGRCWPGIAILLPGFKLVITLVDSPHYIIFCKLWWLQIGYSLLACQNFGNIR